MLGHLQFFKLSVLHSLRIVFSTWSKAEAGCIWLGACIYSNWTSSACFCRPRHISFSQNNGGSRPFRPLIGRNWVVMPNDSFHHRSYAAWWASEPLYPHRRSGMRLLGWEHLSTEQRGASIRSLRLAVRAVVFTQVPPDKHRPNRPLLREPTPGPMAKQLITDRTWQPFDRRADTTCRAEMWRSAR